ncbi:hypothetical protein WME76_20050 [Sorangium sp. So ce119]|uniref:hypothetical protein n=1 Tax=Sorangium sp. So ce119 TaxID=3133279 RepID=UPI003F621616
MTMQKKRKVLRAPFIVTVAAAASLAGAVALPGCDPTVDDGCPDGWACNPPPSSCPEEMPAPGSRCDGDDPSCSYIDGCDNPIDYACVDGAWRVEREMSCNPPPPPACPEEMPERRSSCDADDLSCSYIDGCDNPIGYRCAEGAWRVESEVSCNPPPPACPESLPTTGSACELLGESCSYAGPPDCPEPTVVTCGADGTWSVTIAVSCNPPPPPPPPPPGDCLTAATGEECAGLGPTCQWLVPGCAEGTGTPALAAVGCFPSLPCGEVDAACPAGTRCQEVVVNPCVAASPGDVTCAACGLTKHVCVPPSAATTTD